MAAPAKKRDTKRSDNAGKTRVDKVEGGDADLRAFRALSEVSRRATSKELDRLIRPEK